MQFVPDLQHITHFEDVAGTGTYEVPEQEDETGLALEEATTTTRQGANLSEDTVQAARLLDSVIANLTDNFTEGSDYLRVRGRCGRPIGQL